MSDVAHGLVSGMICLLVMGAMLISVHRDHDDLTPG